MRGRAATDTGRLLSPPQSIGAGQSRWQDLVIGIRRRALNRIRKGDATFAGQPGGAGTEGFRVVVVTSSAALMDEVDTDVGSHVVKRGK